MASFFCIFENMNLSSKIILLSFLVLAAFTKISGQSAPQRQEYQIHLDHPGKSIQLLMYEKDFRPIQGILSEDKKSIIIKNYEKGSKVHVKIEYEDGSVDEFVRSPCFIDPVIAFLKVREEKKVIG